MMEGIMVMDGWYVVSIFLDFKRVRFFASLLVLLLLASSYY